MCEYDAVPKRRGPDKRPGTRQRSCKKRPADGSAPPAAKRKKTSNDSPSEVREIAPSRVKENIENEKHPPVSSRHPDRHRDRRAESQVQHETASPPEPHISTEGSSRGKVHLLVHPLLDIVVIAGIVRSSASFSPLMWI